VSICEPCVELGRSEDASFDAELPVRQDELGVEERQQQQWQHEADHVVHHVHVQPSVEARTPVSTKTQGQDQELTFRA